MNPGIIILIAAAIYFLSKKANPSVITDNDEFDLSISTIDKRGALVSWYVYNDVVPGDPTPPPRDTTIGKSKIFTQAILNMTPDEINVIYAWIFNYYKQNLSFPTSGSLYESMKAIVNHYQIFIST